MSRDKELTHGDRILLHLTRRLSPETLGWMNQQKNLNGALNDAIQYYAKRDVTKDETEKTAYNDSDIRAIIDEYFREVLTRVKDGSFNIDEASLRKMKDNIGTTAIALNRKHDAKKLFIDADK